MSAVDRERLFHPSTLDEGAKRGTTDTLASLRGVGRDDVGVSVIKEPRAHLLRGRQQKRGERFPLSLSRFFACHRSTRQLSTNWSTRKQRMRVWIKNRGRWRNVPYPHEGHCARERARKVACPPVDLPVLRSPSVHIHGDLPPRHIYASQVGDCPRLIRFVLTFCRQRCRRR
jgi:hypothetical protein